MQERNYIFLSVIFFLMKCGWEIIRRSSSLIQWQQTGWSFYFSLGNLLCYSFPPSPSCSLSGSALLASATLVYNSLSLCWSQSASLNDLLFVTVGNSLLNAQLCFSPCLCDVILSAEIPIPIHVVTAILPSLAGNSREMSDHCLVTVMFRTRGEKETKAGIAFFASVFCLFRQKLFPWRLLEARDIARGWICVLWS